MRTKLIDTGKVRWVFRDFPLDQVALTAAMVARALPPERYEPFVLALLAEPGPLGLRPRRSTTPTSCGKMAALAGMDRTDLRRGDRRHRAARLDPERSRTRPRSNGSIDSTPSFVINGQGWMAGEMTYDAFAQG